MKTIHVLGIVVLALTSLSASSPASDSLSKLQKDQIIDGFRVEAAYTDGDNRVRGTRFIHVNTGFTLDLLPMETAPQAFLWVRTFPVSNQGEPHTQEHLLLSKGNQGRHLTSFETMSLAESSAFTAPLHTCYHFQTIAGHKVFWDIFAKNIDALLHPDYSDEEIRREVRHFGNTSSKEGEVELQEMGAVYNEMVRTMENPRNISFHQAKILAYGPNHPLSYEAGGTPEGIRSMTPGDIHAFHQKYYHLKNMGAIAVLSPRISLHESLQALAAILDSQKDTGKGLAFRESDLPKPVTQSWGTIEILDFPYNSADRSGSYEFVWPASRSLSLLDSSLASAFLSAFTYGEGSPLFALLTHEKTRIMDFGPAMTYAWMDSSDPGQPIFLRIRDMKNNSLNKAQGEKVRDIITGELQRIAGLPPQSKELQVFNDRVRTRIIEATRSWQRALESPPQFGIRGIRSEWLDLLRELEMTKNFQRPIVDPKIMAEASKILDSKQNPWKDRLKSWDLIGKKPALVITKPSPSLLKELESGRQERIAQKVQTLKEEFKVRTAEEALARFAKDYKQHTQELEKMEREDSPVPFTKDPPMTQDDSISYQTSEINSVPLITTLFEGASLVSLGVALKLDAVPEKERVFLSSLPILIDNAGVLDEGKSISSQEVKERIKKDILELETSIIASPITHRVELEMLGSGLNAKEGKEALAWIQKLLFHIDWDEKNLVNFREALDQKLAILDSTMVRADETWNKDIPVTLLKQKEDAYLRTQSFLTSAFDIHRVRWMLSGFSDESSRTMFTNFAELLVQTGQNLTRVQMQILAKNIAEDTLGPPYTVLAARIQDFTPELKERVRQLGVSLIRLLPSVPEDSLHQDWDLICRQIAKDASNDPKQTLSRIEKVFRGILHRNNARLFVVGSAESRRSLDQDLQEFTQKLNPDPVQKISEQPRDSVTRRWQERRHSATQPKFFALVNPNSPSASIFHHAPGISALDFDDERILDALTLAAFTKGAKSLGLKVGSSGYSYSNGSFPSFKAGLFTYFAERCPEISMTLKFINEHIPKLRADTDLVNGAVSLLFTSRIAESHEERGESLASDLADGISPERVKALRTRILALKERSDIVESLNARKDRVYKQIFPTLDGKSILPNGSLYLIIGPDKQIDSYEKSLKTSRGPELEVARLYPRDFWRTDGI